VMEAPGFSKREVPLVAGQDVERLGFIGRIGAAAMHLVSGG
jgi:serine-type D-Ala-D-Ala carboxypeptidase (penicillin-binding protein 5/6)